MFLGEDPSEKIVCLLVNLTLAFLRTTTRTLEQGIMSPRWAQNLPFISWGQKKTGISLIPKKDIERVGPSPIALSCLVYLGNTVDPRVVPLKASLLMALNQVTWGCLHSFNSEYELYTLTALLLGLFLLSLLLYCIKVSVQALHTGDFFAFQILTAHGPVSLNSL